MLRVWGAKVFQLVFPEHLLLARASHTVRGSCGAACESRMDVHVAQSWILMDVLGHEFESLHSV